MNTTSASPTLAKQPARPVHAGLYVHKDTIAVAVLPCYDDTKWSCHLLDRSAAAKSNDESTRIET